MDRRLVLALVALVVLAGCGGAGSGGDAATGADGADQTVAESADGGAGGADGGSGPNDDGGDAETDATAGTEYEVDAKTQPRYRIKTATLQVTVDSYGTARDSVVGEARRLGGYVDGESSDRHTRENETWTTGTVVLRVPAENYDQLVAAVEASGTVEQKETKTRDVTDRVVDLRARLRNLKAQRDRLRDLYEDANETEDVLRVGQRLSQVQGDIERVEGQLQVLESQVAYSTVRVELAERPPEPPDEPEPPQWYETSVVAAFLDSVDGVVVMARMFVVGAAYLAPFALAVGVPVVGIYAAVRRSG